MISKKVQSMQGDVYCCARSGNNIFAHVWFSPREQRYTMHVWGYVHSYYRADTATQAEAMMRNHQPDLRKWRKVAY